MDLKVSHSRGGRKEFEETCIYPEYLIFSSKKHNGKWQCTYNSVAEKGSLYIEGKVIFNYVLYNSYCEIQEVNKDGTISDWVEIEITKVLCD